MSGRRGKKPEILLNPFKINSRISKMATIFFSALDPWPKDIPRDHQRIWWKRYQYTVSPSIELSNSVRRPGRLLYDAYIELVL
ncbi:hypothetical protein BDW75DRAFT_189336 [Aspergillus navahoensis]